MEAYLSTNQDAPKVGRAVYRLFTRNYGNSPIYSCSSKSSVACVYDQKLTGSNSQIAYFDCGSHRANTPLK